MMYYNQTLYGWDQLPEYISGVVQMSTGDVNNDHDVVWILTEDDLFYSHNLGTSLTRFRNISSYLDLWITEDSVIAPQPGGHLWVITPENITFLNCSRSAKN